MAELGLILRKNKEARSLDVDHFHDIIRTAQDDQILKVLTIKSSVVSENSIMNIHSLALDIWSAKEPAFASHYCTAPGIFVTCGYNLPIVSHRQLHWQRIRTIPNDSDPERQFLSRGLCAMQNLKAGFIPAPQDPFSMTEFDIVIYHNRQLGKGGFGEVFEGSWHGTKVAIKRIRNFHPAVSTRIIDSFVYSYVP